VNAVLPLVSARAGDDTVALNGQLTGADEDRTEGQGGALLFWLVGRVRHIAGGIGGTVEVPWRAYLLDQMIIDSQAMQASAPFWSAETHRKRCAATASSVFISADSDDARGPITSRRRRQVNVLGLTRNAILTEQFPRGAVAGRQRRLR